MVIKEKENAHTLDKHLRKNPFLMKVMKSNDTQSTGSWVDWFTKENFKIVRKSYICFDRKLLS